MRSVQQDAATYAFLTEQDEIAGNTFGHNLFAPGNRLNDAVVQNYFRWVLKLAPVLQESVFTIHNNANQTVAELIRAGDNATAKASYSVLSFNQSEDEASHIVPGPPPQRDSDLLKQRYRKRVS